jgi:hypothetical protein
MGDLAIMGITLGSLLMTAMLIIFVLTERQSNKRALELKMFQMENTRLIHEWRNESRRSHEDSMKYLEGITGSLARIIRKQEEGEGPK